MKTIAVAVALLLVGTTAALAAPLVPRIASHDFNFGAQEPASVPFYDPRGAGADYLTLAGDSNDREVTAFWEIWPVGGDPISLYNINDAFGGDLELYLEFAAERIIDVVE